MRTAQFPPRTLATMQPFKAPLKAPRLSKSKSNGKLAGSRRESGPTFKASIDDLRDPDGRVSLRNHFTGAFPETQVRPSLESMNSFDTDSRPRLSRSTSYTTTPPRNSTIASSPSSDSLNAAVAKRLSIVREQAAPMDVAQAIKLLEEIKKTATAAELVALHKALLPSVSPQPQDDQMFGLIRRKSMLPPGVATRNASGDLLKTQEAAAAEIRKRRPSVHQRAVTAPVPDQQSWVQDRCNTPDSMSVHMGAYGRGTLRVTNGTASPTPSTLRDEVRKSVEHFETAPSTPQGSESGDASNVTPRDEFRLDNTMAASLKAHQARPATRDEPRKLQKVENNASKRVRRASEPAHSGIPVPEARDIASPRVYRPSRPEKRAKSRDQSREGSQSRTRSWLGRSRRSSKSQVPPPADQPGNDIHVSHTPLRVAVAQEVYISEPTSANEEMMSPTAEDMLRPNMETDLPRFAQRLSYRMSQLPPEAISNSQLPSNPNDNNAALVSLAQRLSSVSNRSSGVQSRTLAAAPEDPEAALAKLNGFVGMQKSSKHGSAGVTIVVDSAADTQDHRGFLDAADSGYGSEISNPALRPGEAREGGALHNGSAIIEKDLNTVHKARQSPDLATSSTPNARGSKKHLSLLGIHITKKAWTAQTQINTSDGNLPEVIGSNVDNPLPKGEKKKLQKAFPVAVMREIKAQKKKADAHLHASDIGSVPDVSEAVRTSFSRHSQQMDAMPHFNDQQYVGTDPADYAISGPTELSSDSRITESPQPIPSPAVSAMHRRSHTCESQHSGSEATIVPRGHPRFKERFIELGGSSRKRSVDMTPGPLEFGDHLVPDDSHNHGSAGIFVGMKDSAAAQFARRRSRDLHEPKVLLGPAVLSRTSSSAYDSAIPPMPQMPPNISAKVTKVDVLAAKHLGNDNTETQAVTSMRETGNKGYSTESVADAVKRAAAIREPAGYSTESVAEAIRKMQKFDSVSKVRKSKSKKKKQLRDDDEKSAAPAVSLVEVKAPLEHNQSPLTDYSDVPNGWEDQAKAWRHRRQSMGEKLSRRTAEEQTHSPVPAQRKRASTSSIHSIPRKPVPSSRSSAEPGIPHHRSYSAEAQAESYRDLIGDADENPSHDGVGWRDSTGTFATVHSQEEERVDSALSARSGAVLLPPTQYQPRPSTDSEIIRQFRNHSLAKLTGAPTYSAKPSFDFPRPIRSRKASFNSLIIGRYSGGSDLGYEGFGGSAGTRGVGDRGLGLGLNLQEDEGLMGVDMSDVPVLRPRAS